MAPGLTPCRGLGPAPNALGGPGRQLGSHTPVLAAGAPRCRHAPGSRGTGQAAPPPPCRPPLPLACAAAAQRRGRGQTGKWSRNALPGARPAEHGTASRGGPAPPPTPGGSRGPTGAAERPARSCAHARSRRACAGAAARGEQERARRDSGGCTPPSCRTLPGSGAGSSRGMSLRSRRECACTPLARLPAQPRSRSRGHGSASPAVTEGTCCSGGSVTLRGI